MVQWSGCSWVTSTPDTPSTASRSDQTPGSTTRSCPPADSRTHEWPNLVIFIRATSQPTASSTKHQRQCSPGSTDLITGCVVAVKCREACRRGEESQQPT